MEDDSEVYKARSKRSRTILALKKILMHNEKDGVGFRKVLPEVFTDFLHPSSLLRLCGR